MGTYYIKTAIGRTVAVLLFVLLAVCGFAQQNTVDRSAAAQVFQKADSLRYIAHYDSSNTLFQKAAALFEQEQNWAQKAEALYKISRNNTKLDQLDGATDYLEKAYALFQTKGLKNTSFEIKYYYQKGVIAKQRADYETALDWTKKGLQLARSTEEQQSIMTKLFVNIGEIYIGQGYYQKAIEQAAKAENMYHRSNLEDDRLLSRIYNSYGKARRSNGDLNRALNYFRQSLEIDQRTLPAPHPKLAQANNNIAISYYHKGDYQRALDYFTKAVHVLADFYGEDHRLVAAGYNNVGIVYSEKGELQKATEYLEKSLQIKEKILGSDHPDIAIGYQNLGAIYYDMGKYDQAIDHYKKSEELHLKRFPEGHPELANVYANLGEAYAQKEAFEKALNYYQKDLNINLERLDSHHPFLGDTFTKIGRTYAMIENYGMALNYYRRALEVFVPGYSREAEYENPPFEQLAYPYLLLKTLKRKGRALQKQAEQSDRQNLFEQSLQTHLQAAELIDYLQRSYSRNESKFVLRERTEKIYTRGFDVAYSLHKKTSDPRYKEYAFYFVEKSQNQILLEHVQRINARDLVQIPDSLTEKEQNLQQKVTTLQSQLSELAKSPQQSDSLQRADLQDSLFLTRKKLDEHIRFLEASYPKYHKLKYEPVITRVNQIQQNILSPDQVMISYFFGEGSLFALIISADSFKVRKLPADSMLQQDIQEYRNAILNSSSSAVFAEIGHQLYNKLINPIASLIDDNDLLIIPDRTLHYLPFGSLVSSAVSDLSTARYHNLSYLVQNHSISYAPSAGYLHLRNPQGKSEWEKQFIGFAPDFSKIETSSKRDFYPDFKRPVSPLPLSKEEVEELGALFNSNTGFLSFLRSGQEKADIYVGDTASEQTFKSLPLENYRFIHLATHAYASEENPERSGILFTARNNSKEGSTLHAAEIYNLQLNAQLVTLSACETGIGAIAEGEGIMSLSRAFQYSGARNLLVSLWKVNDRSTARLMIDFYTLNEKEIAMPPALREAKINMINETPYSHPKYWAPFIFIGS